ncbi:MAG: VWA domain-containing protein, partial [Chloroflexi bacterium]|nr:VWA domain-containing protein [Chloroflexota bacterium]
SLIDHYLIGTTVLNTNIYQGKSFGHFFIMPEDNLIHLYEGTERAYINGVKTTAPPIEERMVMIYPKEGSMPRNNCACIVDADWVTPQQVEAAKVWIDYIREDEQQRAFMAAGFRPGTEISLNDPASKITAEFGLNPNPPRVVLNPSLTDPAVAAAIDENWIHVKRPGIVNFVIDTSGSMDGGKLTQAKDGLIRALDSMASNNQVGFLSFSDNVRAGVPIGPLIQNRFQIASAVGVLRADGQTALYDAIKAGIEMVDAVDGDPDAIRAVVVLTDGQANKGNTTLDAIVDMSSRSETRIETFSGFVDISHGRDQNGRPIRKEDIIGSNLAIETRHEIQIFFIGIGEDADIQVGRILAGATSAEFQGTAEDDLANLLEEFSKYF